MNLSPLAPPPLQETIDGRDKVSWGWSRWFTDLREYVRGIAAGGNPGPKGDKGDKGDTGETGATGAQGDPGTFDPSIPVDFIQFNTNNTPAANAEGLLQWNSEDGTLDLGMDLGRIKLQIGQELFVKVYNDTGDILFNGAVVYIDTAINDRPTARLANNKSEVMTYKTIGILTDDILAGEEGFATVFGKVRDLNTTGFALGDILYVSSTDGALTNVRPTTNHWVTNVGVVTKIGTADGEVFVRSIQYQKPDETSLINGFPNTTDTTIAFTDVSRTFTITPTGADFVVYQAGLQYRKTAADTVVITDTEGTHWIYYDLGVLTALANPTQSQQETLIRLKCVVAQIYWDTDNKYSILVGDERHGIIMDPYTHAYLHFVFGARWISGMALNTVNATGSGANSSDAQFGMDTGVGTDEDLVRIVTSPIASTVGLPIMYLSGANGALRRATQAGYSVLKDTTMGVGSTGRIVYNKNTAGVWSLATVTDNDYVLCHVFSTNDPAQPYVAFIGHNDYTNAANARTGAETEISTIVSGFPRAELIPIATLIFNTKNTFANAVKSRVVEISTGVAWADWRSTAIQAAAGSPTDHNSLSGKQGGTAGEYYHQTLIQNGVVDTSGNVNSPGTITAQTYIAGNLSSKIVFQPATPDSAITMEAGSSGYGCILKTHLYDSGTGGVALQLNEAGGVISTGSPVNLNTRSVDATAPLRVGYNAGGISVITDNKVLVGTATATDDPVGTSGAVKLQVSGSAETHAMVQNTTDSNLGYLLKNGDGNTWLMSHRSNANELQWYYHNGTAWSSALLTVLADGRVGIGTAAPTHKLHINASAGNEYAVVKQDSTHSIELGWIYNVTPSAAYGILGTYGYNNPIKIDGSTVYLQSLSGGNTESSGYTKLGSTAPAIKMKKLTGTTANAEGGTTDVAHGLTRSKIIGCQVLVDTGSASIPPEYNENYSGGSPGYIYNYYIDATNFRLFLDDTRSQNILSKGFTVLLTYEE